MKKTKHSGPHTMHAWRKTQAPQSVKAAKLAKSNAAKQPQSQRENHANSSAAATRP